MATATATVSPKADVVGKIEPATVDSVKQPAPKRTTTKAAAAKSSTAKKTTGKKAKKPAAKRTSTKAKTTRSSTAKKTTRKKSTKKAATPKLLKAIVETDALRDALKLLRPLAKSFTMVTQYVVIESYRDKLRVRATDLETAARIEIDKADIAQPGAIAVPMDKLLASVSQAASPTITLEHEPVTPSSDGQVIATDSNAKLSIRAERSTVVLYGTDAKDSPAFPELGDDKKAIAALAIRHAELADSLQAVTYAVASEHSRYAINGVYIEKGKAKAAPVKMAATDGRRLVVREVETQYAETMGAIVPLSVATLLQKFANAFCEEDGDVTLRFDTATHAAAMDGATWNIRTRLVEGVFPPYVDVIPKLEKQDITATVKSDELLAAVRNAAITTDEDNKGVRCDFDKTGLTITSKGAPGQADVQRCDVSEYAGGKLAIGMNPRYLSDIAKVSNGQDLHLRVRADNKPLRADGERTVHVLMPVNIA